MGHGNKIMIYCEFNINNHSHLQVIKAILSGDQLTVERFFKAQMAKSNEEGGVHSFNLDYGQFHLMMSFLTVRILYFCT